jgi:hypothetical protein
MVMSRHLGRQLFLLWLPTAFGASMLVAEIPLVYAAVARSVGGDRALAAMGICVSLLVVVNTPALALTPLVTVQAGQRGLRWYALAIGFAGAAVLLLVALVPSAMAALRAVFGLDVDVASDVRDGLIGLSANSVGVALRRHLHGRFIWAGRTWPITRATVIRIAGTGALAWAGVALVPEHGALVGGLALSVGALLETALLAVAARALPRPAPTRGERLRALVRRHSHLSASRLMAMVPMMITTLGIAHSAEPTASLIVWPALYELVMLFSSPAGDWESVTARALHSGMPARWLTVRLAAGFAVAFALIVLAGPGEFYLRHLVTVPAGPTDLGLRWAPVLFAVPVLWVVRAYLHGVLMAVADTAWLLWASVTHVVVLSGAAVALSATALPGVAVGSFALVAGLVVDVAVTARGARSAEFSGRTSRARDANDSGRRDKKVC